jgi:anthranilate phosphoribosyltransferase
MNTLIHTSQNPPATPATARTGLVERLFHPHTSESEIAAILLSLQPGAFSGEDLSLMLELIMDDFLNLREGNAAEREFLLELGKESIDCAGTGGSGQAHFNTSTAVAFTLAAAGISVTKFGNKAAGGRSGSFDLLEFLGFPCNICLEALSEVVAQTNLALLFAQQFYPGLSRLAPIRRSIGVPTVLNYLGPLLNPALPSMRLMGIANQAVIAPVANHLISAGNLKSAMLVRGAGGLDEIEGTGISHFFFIEGSRVTEGAINACDLLERAGTPAHDSLPNLAQNVVLDQKTNALLLLKISSGADQSSEYFRQVVLNTAAAMLVAGQCNSLVEGCRIAQNLLKTGLVAKYIDKCRRLYERISC